MGMGVRKYAESKERGERELPMRSDNLEEKGESFKENIERRHHKVCAKSYNKNEDKDGGGTPRQHFEF